jgi:hypothetical protein
MTKPDTQKPDRPATSPAVDYVGPIRELEVDPDNVGSVHSVEPQEPQEGDV